MPGSPSAPAFDIPERPNPLPSRPNLEFERKRTKKLLRTVRSGDPAILQRVRRFRADAEPADVKLSDVQLTVAREYGFTSWPKLATYFATWGRHERSGPRDSDPGPRTHLDNQVRVFMQNHHNRRSYEAQMLATYVPRFYGRSDSEIFSSPVNEEDAQLVVARTGRYASWESLLAAPPKDYRLPPERYSGTVVRGLDLIRNQDIEGLKQLVDEDGTVLRVKDVIGPDKNQDLLLRTALWVECSRRSAESRAITDWLVSQGGDIQSILNHLLIEQPFIHNPDDIAFLLERGADPDWLPPNGVSVLEHAIIRSWNPDVVDLIAHRIVPRKAFWICAGLGDVPGMLNFLTAEGKPTPAARRDRPDITAVFFGALCRPDAGDMDIVWEAFYLAGTNRRFACIDALLDRGFPVDYAPWGMTLLQWAEGNQVTPLVDHLTKRGTKIP